MNRGGPAELIEDALQCAALHLLDRAEGFDSFDGLVGWVIKVAWNEVKMVWRRQARVAVGQVPERPDGSDSTATVEARLDLAAAIRGLGALSHPEREVILSSLVDYPFEGRHETAAVRMRRYRARRHLASRLAADGNNRIPPTRRWASRPPVAWTSSHHP